MLVQDMAVLGERAADPEAICKLFTAAAEHELGGASYKDLATGTAQPWQRTDRTYRLCKGAGRVVWEAVSPSEAARDTDLEDPSRVVWTRPQPLY